MTKEEILAGVIEDLKALKQTWIERAKQNETHDEMIFEGRIGQIQECIDIVISHNDLQSENGRLKAEREIYVTYDKRDGEVFCAFTNKEQCEMEAKDGGCGMQTVRLITTT